MLYQAASMQAKQDYLLRASREKRTEGRRQSRDLPHEEKLRILERQKQQEVFKKSSWYFFCCLIMLMRLIHVHF